LKKNGSDAVMASAEMFGLLNVPVIGKKWLAESIIAKYCRVQVIPSVTLMTPKVVRRKPFVMICCLMRVWINRIYNKEHDR
jgi:hypothetical protein